MASLSMLPCAVNLRQPASSLRASRSRLRVRAFAAPQHLQLLSDQGPGTGHRHYPEGQQKYERRLRCDDGGNAQHHSKLTTEQCYELFPLITHASTPLRVEDPTPAGVSSLRAGDAGPATGRRRRPAPADAQAAAHHPALPYPDTRAVDLSRELLIRHAPELVLQQRA